MKVVSKIRASQRKVCHICCYANVARGRPQDSYHARNSLLAGNMIPLFMMAGDLLSAQKRGPLLDFVCILAEPNNAYDVSGHCTRD